ncbi:AGR381Cp [Eremothecium gossypii ATCC 10895]|uniref:Peroxisomal membrane protein PEX14 n=1 Tax=Eremothecium gossypii (strain ATCC 10895 / CBS 109.51 / FGSC 9923 / NRRL Y-1056) TaxID=284811 RepID=Q74Z25_EREGS|nr:AGR381Cp [Eremothecium gossypii ATCC 10895]AAS54871.1 AGR381Cp [Eremothecium gossypii ATCC 10895]AEY99203.1 FAGR381Cp [Eremothecium gossypii FDAG1]
MPGTIAEDRKELFASAVSFLGEPSVQTAPLTKKVEFLQTKGLTEDEIQLALEQAGKADTQGRHEVVQSAGVGAGAVMQDVVYETVPPPLPRRDWKDYFVMATATAGLCYGLYEVTRRYVVPQLLPESRSRLEQDKRQIEDHFEKVDRLLEKLEQEQDEFRDQQVEKLKELDATIIKLQGALEETTKTRNNINFEFRDLKLQVTEMAKKLDEFRQARDHNSQLTALQSDMESLKRLIKNSTLLSSPAPGAGSAPPAVPLAASIPSASEILAKMKSNTRSEDGEAMPSWKIGRKDLSAASIPDWQKTALSSREQSPEDSLANGLSHKLSLDNLSGPE